MAAAHDLLSWRSLKAVVTRGGKWDRLSKILTGDLSVDLFDHLREFKRRSNASVEKKRVELSVELIVYRKRALGIK